MDRLGITLIFLLGNNLQFSLRAEAGKEARSKNSREERGLTNRSAARTDRCVTRDATERIIRWIIDFRTGASIATQKVPAGHC